MNKKPNTGYNRKLCEPARELRKNMTKQEKHLWYDYLRTYHLKWYRQRPVDRFIVDFYCSVAKVVVEIDGSQHYTDEGIEYDRARTEILKQYNIEVLRFTNKDIDDRFSEVCKTIDRKVMERLSV